MPRIRNRTVLVLASAFALMVVGLAIVPPMSTASAAPSDRWLEVQPSCCGDSGAFVGLAGA